MPPSPSRRPCLRSPRRLCVLQSTLLRDASSCFAWATVRFLRLEHVEHALATQPSDLEWRGGPSEEDAVRCGSNQDPVRLNSVLLVHHLFFLASLQNFFHEFPCSLDIVNHWCYSEHTLKQIQYLILFVTVISMRYNLILSPLGLLFAYLFSCKYPSCKK